METRSLTIMFTDMDAKAQERMAKLKNMSGNLVRLRRWTDKLDKYHAVRADILSETETILIEWKDSY